MALMVPGTSTELHADFCRSRIIVINDHRHGTGLPDAEGPPPVGGAGGKGPPHGGPQFPSRARGPAAGGGEAGGGAQGGAGRGGRVLGGAAVAAAAGKGFPPRTLEQK